MKRYLDPTKLLQEGKITSSEFEKIKSLSSKWDSPYIFCFFMAITIVIGILSMSGILGPLLLFSPIIILGGFLLMLLERKKDKC